MKNGSYILLEVGLLVVFFLLSKLMIWAYKENSLYPFLKYRRCKVKVKGIISEIVSDYTQSKGHKYTLYRPKCTYRYNGKEYCEKLLIELNKNRDKVGDEITFNINPDKPEEINKITVSSILFWIIGTVFNGLAAILFMLNFGVVFIGLLGDLFGLL